MNEKEPNFEALKKLLKLKRHEVPVPGYFNNFSGQVIARIRAGEAAQAQGFMERLEESAPWLGNFLRIFETRPGLVGGFATSLCLLLLLTVVFTEHNESAPKDIFAMPDTAAAAAVTTSPSLATAPGSAMLANANPSPVGGIMVSTNPVTSLQQPLSTLFGQPSAGALFQPPSLPASFAPVGQ